MAVHGGWVLLVVVVEVVEGEVVRMVVLERVVDSVGLSSPCRMRSSGLRWRITSAEVTRIRGILSVDMCEMAVGDCMGLVYGCIVGWITRGVVVVVVVDS